jgi:hypothetical protein
MMKSPFVTRRDSPPSMALLTTLPSCLVSTILPPVVTVPVPRTIAHISASVRCWLAFCGSLRRSICSR